MTYARDLGDAANKANYLDNVNSDIQMQIDLVLPAGFILPFGGTSAPLGFLACEGQEVLQSAYPALYAAIGTTWGTASSAATHFKLPDLRGAFLRGTGSHGTENMANGSDFAGPSVGSFENDQMQGHRHAAAYQSSAIQTGYNTSYGIYINGFNNYDGVGEPRTDGTNGTPRVGDETRPFNAGILYCIKT